jgi:hypothetical protein
VRWNTQRRAFVDPGRDRYFELVFLVDFAATATGCTGFIDETPLAVAYRADANLLIADRTLVLGFLA